MQVWDNRMRVVAFAMCMHVSSAAQPAWRHCQVGGLPPSMHLLFTFIDSLLDMNFT
jgi:hypothetical protein